VDLRLEPSCGQREELRRAPPGNHVLVFRDHRSPRPSAGGSPACSASRRPRGRGTRETRLRPPSR
jgi:hypothetical protein